MSTLQLPYIKAYRENWETARRLSALMNIGMGDAFLWICTLHRWGTELGPEGADPTGLCESPRGIQLMAAAVGCPLDRAQELAEWFEDLGLLECLVGGPVRVKGVRELYAGITEAREARSEHARKAANARWGNGADAPSMPGACPPDAQPVPGDAKRKMKIEKKIDPQIPLSAEQPADRAVVVFEHWRKVMGKNARSALDDKRRRAVEARLKDGYTIEDLCRAVDGCALTPHNMGQNDKKTRYDDLELICRDAAHVDRFRATAETAGPREPEREDINELREVMRLSLPLGAYVGSQLAQCRWRRSDTGFVGAHDDGFFARWLDEKHGAELAPLGITFDAPAQEGAAA